MSAPGTVAWLARHEFRLAWRDWRSMVTAGRRRRGRTIVAILAVFALFMHGIAFAMLPRQIGVGEIDKATLLAITGCRSVWFEPSPPLPVDAAPSPVLAPASHTFVPLETAERMLVPANRFAWGTSTTCWNAPDWPICTATRLMFSPAEVKAPSAA